MATEQEALESSKAQAAAAHADYVVEGAERNLAAVESKIERATGVVDNGGAALDQAQAALDDAVVERELAVAHAASLNPGTAVSAGLAEATGLEN